MDSPHPPVPAALSFPLPRPRSAQITGGADSGPEISAEQLPAPVPAPGLNPAASLERGAQGGEGTKGNPREEDACCGLGDVGGRIS